MKPLEKDSTMIRISKINPDSYCIFILIFGECHMYYIVYVLFSFFLDQDNNEPTNAVVRKISTPIKLQVYCYHKDLFFMSYYCLEINGCGCEWINSNNH